MNITNKGIINSSFFTYIYPKWSDFSKSFLYLATKKHFMKISGEAISDAFFSQMYTYLDKNFSLLSSSFSFSSSSKRKEIFAQLTLTWRSLSYRNQSTDLQRKSTDWFLYDRELRHERVKILKHTRYYQLILLILYSILLYDILYTPRTWSINHGWGVKREPWKEMGWLTNTCLKSIEIVP